MYEMYVPIYHSETMVNNERKLINDIKDANAFNSRMYDASIVRHYVNNPYNWDVIPIESKDQEELIQPVNLKKEIILPKEEEVINIVKQENRKVWIYTDFTGESGTGQYMQGENIPERIIRHLKAEGIKVFWLKPSTKPIDRKELIEKNKDKYDVFLSNPKLTEVGINMVWCSTYIVHTPSYQVNVITQAIRRGYRANSTQENRIYHMYYKETIEESICTRYQKKVAESQAIEGKFNAQIESEDIRTASALGKKNQ